MNFVVLLVTFFTGCFLICLEGIRDASSSLTGTSNMSPPTGGAGDAFLDVDGCRGDFSFRGVVDGGGGLADVCDSRELGTSGVCGLRAIAVKP